MGKNVINVEKACDGSACRVYYWWASVCTSSGGGISPFAEILLPFALHEISLDEEGCKYKSIVSSLIVNTLGLFRSTNCFGCLICFGKKAQIRISIGPVISIVETTRMCYLRIVSNIGQRPIFISGGEMNSNSLNIFVLGL